MSLLICPEFSTNEGQLSTMALILGMMVRIRQHQQPTQLLSEYLVTERPNPLLPSTISNNYL